MTLTRHSLTSEQRLAILAFIEELADLARPEVLAHFRQPDMQISDKTGTATGFDPVTAADRDAEAAIRAHLERHRPDDGIIGEEFGTVAGRSGLQWIIDPIDGTRGYMCGTPVWGVLIALADAEGPFLGVIDQPYIGERFLGGLGESRIDGPMGRAPLRCRNPRPLAESLLSSTMPRIGTPSEVAGFARVADRVRLTRYGLDCYAYAMLAAGQIDLVVEAGLKPYDIAAPIAVIEAAGGCVTDWNGGPAGQGGQVLAAANRAIHAEAMALLAG